MDVKAALKGQYHSAMRMLNEAIEKCPDNLWTATGERTIPFWRVAYHTLFFTDLYLRGNLDAFRPWRLHRKGIEHFGSGMKDAEPYTKAQVLEYWAICDSMVDPALDTMDLDAPECGFHWYKLPKLDHQLNNIRHIQHHAAILISRLRTATGIDVHWQSFK